MAAAALRLPRAGRTHVALSSAGLLLCLAVVAACAVPRVVDVDAVPTWVVNGLLPVVMVTNAVGICLLWGTLTLYSGGVRAFHQGGGVGVAPSGVFVLVAPVAGSLSMVALCLAQVVTS